MIANKNSKDYKQGKESARDTVKSKGYVWTNNYLNEKLSYSDIWTAQGVFDYWQGYSDHLKSVDKIIKIEDLKARYQKTFDIYRDSVTIAFDKIIKYLNK